MNRSSSCWAFKGSNRIRTYLASLPIALAEVSWCQMFSRTSNVDANMVDAIKAYDPFYLQSVTF